MKLFGLPAGDIIRLVLIIISSGATVIYGFEGLLATIILVIWTGHRFREQQQKMEEIEKKLEKKRDRGDPIVEGASL